MAGRSALQALRLNHLVEFGKICNPGTSQYYKNVKEYFHFASEKCFLGTTSLHAFVPSPRLQIEKITAYPVDQYEKLKGLDV